MPPKKDKTKTKQKTPKPKQKKEKKETASIKIKDKSQNQIVNVNINSKQKPRTSKKESSKKDELSFYELLQYRNSAPVLQNASSTYPIDIQNMIPARNQTYLNIDQPRTPQIQYNQDRPLYREILSGVGNASLNAGGGIGGITLDAARGVGGITVNAARGVGNIVPDAVRGTGGLASDALRGAGGIATDATRAVGRGISNIVPEAVRGAGGLASDAARGAGGIATNATMAVGRGIRYMMNPASESAQPTQPTQQQLFRFGQLNEQQDPAPPIQQVVRHRQPGRIIRPMNSNLTNMHGDMQWGYYKRGDDDIESMYSDITSSDHGDFTNERISDLNSIMGSTRSINSNASEITIPSRQTEPSIQNVMSFNRMEDNEIYASGGGGAYVKSNKSDSRAAEEESGDEPKDLNTVIKQMHQRQDNLARPQNAKIGRGSTQYRLPWSGRLVSKQVFDEWKDAGEPKTKEEFDAKRKDK